MFEKCLNSCEMQKTMKPLWKVKGFEKQTSWKVTHHTHHTPHTTHTPPPPPPHSHTTTHNNQHNYTHNHKQRHTPNPHTAHFQHAQEERDRRGHRDRATKRQGGQTEDWTANVMALKKSPVTNIDTKKTKKKKKKMHALGMDADQGIR